MDRFQTGSPFSLGVEEELLFVDPQGYALRPVPGRLPATVSAAVPAGWISGEVSRAEVELITPICRDAGEATWILRHLRAGVAAAGGHVLGIGVHPAGRFADIRATSGPRYDRVVRELQGLLRTPTAALQIHVGMPDPGSAILAHNALREWTPLLHALAAGSPFWHERDSGLASARSAVVRSYPRAGIPPAFEDYGHFLALAHELAAIADVPDYTYFWWEVRPHPRFGTVEVRTMDSQASLARTAALTALVHGLARAAVERPAAGGLSHEALCEALFQASRWGLCARLPDREGRLRPVPDLARAAVRVARPHLDELGGAEAVDGIEAILLGGDEATRQRRVEATGGMAALLRDLAERTCACGVS